MPPAKSRADGRLTSGQLGAVLVAARLDRIPRRAHMLSGPLEEGISIRAADMPGVDDLMMRLSGDGAEGAGVDLGAHPGGAGGGAGEGDGAG